MKEDILNLFIDDEVVNSFGLGQGSFSASSFMSKALLIASSFNKNPKKIMLVTNSLHNASLIYEYLSNLLDEEHLLTFFSDETIQVEAYAESLEMSANRIYSLYKLIKENTNRILITHTSAFLRYLPTVEIFKDNIKKILVGQTLKKEELVQYLMSVGYKSVSKVSTTLEFSKRGEIVDVFSINYDNPIRIEFFDDEIESVRFFDIETQKTISMIDHIYLIPASEILIDDTVNIKEILLKLLDKDKEKLDLASFQSLKDALDLDIYKLENNYKEGYLYKYYSLISKYGTLNDYFNSDICVFMDFESINSNYELLLKDSFEYKEELFNSGKTLSMLNLYQDLNDVLKDINKRIYLNDISKVNDKVFNIVSIINCYGSSKIAARLIKNYIDLNYEIYIHLNNEHQKNNLDMWCDEFSIDKNKFTLVDSNLVEGFEIGDRKIVFLSARELFLNKLTSGRYFTKYKSATLIQDYQDLTPGDYLVHETYGIGKYLGIETVKVNNMNKDYMKLEYKNGESLFVPLEQFSLVRKYSLSEGKAPSLNKLGSNDWNKTKQRIKEKVEDIAGKLIVMYEERTKKIGYAFSASDELEMMFANDFPYVLTKDQKNAIAMMKKEMESKVPMDLLLCGDVGFGKTEVAFVGAFKAIKDNKQVVFLCPTTLLSMQHYQNALDRFKNFNVRIEVLNRFKTPKEVETILKHLKEGKVDMLIGTHRVLSKDVVFKDLGLLIVDEEQRFGVEHKEKIKELKNSIDVLTLSATPIPRTMQMSLIGIRSLAQLTTPPLKRMPIQTYVVEKNPRLIKEVIEREIGRGGQVFYLHNNTSDLKSIAFKIEQEIKGSKVGIIHGKMDREVIEQTTYDFYNNKINVLVSTTIIETGIDIPNANTMIIENADHFGLSQLYQIKGRVGRSDRIAYAYLLYNPKKKISEVAYNRLKAIKEFTELGSGYKIALRDLSIRGAGDILGENQSGFIENVGIDLYLDLLKEAIEERKGIAKKEEIKNNNIQINGYIPLSYAECDGNKIDLYKQLEKITTLTLLEEFEKNVSDMYGKMPSNVSLLIEKKRIDILASEDKVSDIKDSKDYIDIFLSKELSNKDGIGVVLFEKANLLDYKNINLSFAKDNIKIRIIKNNTNWVYYIKEILESI